MPCHYAHHPRFLTLALLSTARVNQYGAQSTGLGFTSCYPFSSSFAHSRTYPPPFLFNSEIFYLFTEHFCVKESPPSPPLSSHPYSSSSSFSLHLTFPFRFELCYSIYHRGKAYRHTKKLHRVSTVYPWALLVLAYAVESDLNMVNSSNAKLNIARHIFSCSMRFSDMGQEYLLMWSHFVLACTSAMLFCFASWFRGLPLSTISFGLQTFHQLP